VARRRARRGSGHIYRRGAIYWFKFFDARSKPHWRSSGSRDRRVAEAMLRAQLGQRDLGGPVLPDPRRVPVDTLLDNLLAEYRLNGRRSIGRADLSCRHLRRFFEGRAAGSVTGADVNRYADLRRQEKAAPATVNRELAALRRAYRLAIRHGLLATMPPITMLREDNVRTGFFDDRQIDAVCRYLTTKRSKRAESEQWERAAVVRFCYITGWRSSSEEFSLRWSQVDLKNGFVRLEPGTTKNKEGRTFPLTPELRALLEQRLEYTRRCERTQDRIIPYVFHRKGQPIQGMRRSWKTACEKAGVSGRLLHDLRRSAVRNLERAGVSRSVAMKMTGRKTESVYRRYAIVSESDLREAAAKLAAIQAAR
jgi:integrase